jgi:hypothetical protein
VWLIGTPKWDGSGNLQTNQSMSIVKCYGSINTETKYQKVCEHFMAPLYEFIFFSPPPCMTDKEITVIKRIGDWFLLEHGTYIRIYGSMKSPHLLP